ncbi:MAG: glycoside hydrolase family 43 [Clostridia bacterium]|nr:glycoside hydrolase family 43 [Clostridia bacterium]
MQNIKDIQIRDPFVLKDHGKYYLFGSTDKNIWGDNLGTGFDVYVGEDLENWEGPHFAFRPEKDFWGKTNFWAPEVYKYKEAYYMFATFCGEDGMRGTAILRSENPTGPFREWSEGAVTPKEWMCLDGTFYVDENQQPWMIFCHEWVQIKDGTICAVRLSEDLKSTIGEVITLFKSTDAWWSSQVTSKSFNITGWVTDGCNLHKMKNGKLLMQWSCMGEEGYCIAYALSDNGSILGPWQQAEAPLFKKDGGHGMIFETYDNRLLLSIHTPNDSPNERAAFFELIETQEGLELK